VRDHGIQLAHQLITRIICKESGLCMTILRYASVLVDALRRL
jgi:hypothetical protein